MQDVAGEIEKSVRHTAAALEALADRLPGQAAALARCVELIVTACAPAGPGRLVLTGVGKAGHVARKLAATFASTGTAACFLHPGEARHGDLGVVLGNDVLLAVSNSGSSEELVALVPELERRAITLLALVGHGDSPLVAAASAAVVCGRHAETCHLGLAPTTSTTVLLTVGDALAMAVSHRRGLSAEDYARNHPGGALGRRLLAVGDVMRTGERMVAIVPETPTTVAIHAVSRARVGSAVLIDEDQRLLGILTDGDLRRALDGADDPGAIIRAPVAEHATCPCQAIRDSAALTTALRLCAERKINELPVIDAGQRVLGLLDLQDLVDRGFEIDDG